MRKLLTFLLMLVLASGVGWAETATITIEYGDTFTPALPTASSNVNTTATTHTVNGLSIAEKGIYKGSQNNYLMFVQNNGYLYNTQSLGTINSVAVTYSSGTSTSAKTGVYFGSSVQSTYTSSSNKTIAGQSKTDTWTNETTGNGYFQLSTSNKNTQITKIVINYTPSSTPQPTTYSITGTGATTGGTISATATSGISSGTSITLTATPDSGYELTEFFVNGTDVFSSMTEGTNGVYTYTMSVTGDVTVSATFTAQSSGGGTQFERITNVNDLEAGKRYILVYETTPAGMGAITTSGTKFGTSVTGSSNITVTNGVATLPSGSNVKPLVLGGSTNAWTFTIDGALLNYPTNSTANTLTTGNDNSSWKISFSGNDVTITNANSNRVIKYNSSSPRFACYTSGQQAIQLYKEVVPVVDKAYDVTVTQSTGGTITASPEGEKVVDSGDKITVTATPETGYELTSWNITGASESAPDANNQITATGNVTITATFSKINYQIATNVNPSNSGCAVWMNDGFTTINNVATATYGATVKVQLHTVTGWMVDPTTPITVVDANNNAISATLDSTPNDGPIYKFTMPASNVTITGNFAVYHGTLRLAGHFNGNSTWREGNAGPNFTYDSSTDKYTIRAYFTGIDDNGANDYFFLTLDGVAKHPQANQGNYYIYDLNGGEMPFNLSGGGSNNFGCAPGVYDIEINGSLTSMSFTKITPTVTLSPNGGDVEAGQMVTATSTLTTLINGITDSGKGGTVAVQVSTNQSTWTDDVTLSTVGSGQIVYGKASIGNIVETTNATFNVTAVNTSNVYELVTTDDGIESNKKYLLVCESGNYAYKGGKLGEAITISDHKTTLSNENGPNVKPLILGVETIDGTNYYNFSYTDGGTTYYLANVSATNDGIGTETTLTDAGRWTIGISSGTATITNKSTSRLLRAYSTNTDFRSYTSTSNQPVQLYRQAVEEVKAFTINYAEVTGGSASGVTGANAGDEITVTVTPDQDYTCTGVAVTTDEPDNSPLAVTDNHDGTYTFTVPSNFHGTTITVTPSFNYAPTYAITYVAEPAAGGSVTGVARAAEADDVIVNVTPNADYQLVSLVYSWNNGAGSQAVSGDGTAASPYHFTMPHYATTVTATFEKIPHAITVVSTNGSVTGIPATATSGTSITFTVTPNAGYVVSSVSGTFNNGNSGLNITDNGDNSYTFSMPASDVAITVTYFASEDYELLTDLSDINAEDTYLIVGGPANDLGNMVNVMGTATSNDIMGVVGLTSTNYENGIIHSTSDMAIVNFLIGTGDDAGKYAIHTADGYITTSSVKGSTPTYMSITLDGDASRAIIGNYFSYNSSSPRWKYYSTQQGANYIFKLANQNKVKRPGVTGAAGEYLGLYNFIGKDNVSMTCATDGATIEYSLDGGTTWLTYSEAFEISTAAAGNTVEVMARATKTGMETSDVVTATFTCIKPQAPTFGTNAAGDYVNPVFVYPKSALNDRRAYGQDCATYYYVTDGSTTGIYTGGTEVTTSNSNGYYIYLDDNANLQVVTVINGIASDPAGGAYTFSVAAPVFSLAGGTYDGNQQTRMSTETKSQLNNKSWTTKIYYTTGNTEFAFNSETGEVTSSEWIEYDGTNSPYIDLLVENSPITLRAVTLSNYFDNVTEYRVSTETTATYTLTAANLSVVATPAPGTYVNTVNVTLEAKNAVGEYLIYYTTDGSDPSTNGTEYTGTAITVDHDMTIKVYAMDSRSGDGGTATLEAAYKIGVQAPVYSPIPGNYYKGDDEDINVEIFSVTPNAKIYYTMTDDGSTPADPTSSSTLYTGDIPLETGKTYNFKAIAYVGSSRVSGISSATYTVSAKGSGWLNVKEMAESSGGTTKTLDNPVQVVYMSTWRYNGEKPEFAFVRDNSGYGLIYFGGSGVTKYNDYTKFQMGDWLAGGTITGTMANWDSSFINELGSSAGSVSAWPETSIGNTAILPEEVTNADIKAGWTYNGSYTGSDYATYIDPDKNLFGHYVHMRKNTISNLSLNSQKYLGQITDQSGVPLNYYDGLYLFSGHNGRPTYDQTFFDNIQNKGGTFDVYGLVYFYGPNAHNATYSNAPYEIFPIDFEWIYKPLFNIESGTYHETQTVTLTCETEGAQIWYKTSEMEDYELYSGPLTIDATTQIDAYSTLPSKFGDQLESIIETLNITMGTIEQPEISPESSVNAVGADPITCTITCATEDATIYYTTDGSDPKTSETRMVYTDALTISETTTIRAIAYSDNGNDGGYYSVEAEPKTYTFVKSNGIEYTLVTNANQLNENSVYVIVNRENAMAMQRTQKANNRDGAGVLFKDADQTIVYGNDDLAVFTLNGSGSNWTMHTANGSNNASTGYIYGAVTGSTNRLLTLTGSQSDDNSIASITIDATTGEAHISFLYDGASTRYLRFWDRDNLFNTYGSETNEPVYLYYKEATPLAVIEKTGTKDAQYTVADELIGVYAFGNILWCKDQGNVSIDKREMQDGQIDYMKFALEGNNVVVPDTWDQSNWVAIQFTGNDAVNHASEGVNKFIAPATVTGVYSDDVNYTITMPAGQGLSFNEGEPNYVKNTYSAANFVSSYWNGVTYEAGAREFFFVNPKVQEVATITWAVWMGDDTFVIPAKNEDKNHNMADLDGAFKVNWNYADGDAIKAALNANGVGNEAYQFTGVINKTTTSPSQGIGRSTKGIGKDGQTPAAGFEVSPLDLSVDNDHIVTGINNVNGDGVKEVKAVRIYNVAGVEQRELNRGVNIVVTEYTDGTISTNKIMK